LALGEYYSSVGIFILLLSLLLLLLLLLLKGRARSIIPQKQCILRPISGLAGVAATTAITAAATARVTAPQHTCRLTS
jgi:hypothetical protein